jgi:hypothetical protein
VITSPSYENQVHESIGGIQACEDKVEAKKLGYSKPECSARNQPAGCTRLKLKRYNPVAILIS